MLRVKNLRVWFQRIREVTRVVLFDGGWPWGGDQQLGRTVVGDLGFFAGALVTGIVQEH